MIEKRAFTRLSIHASSIRFYKLTNMKRPVRNGSIKFFTELPIQIKIRLASMKIDDIKKELAQIEKRIASLQGYL